MADNNPSIYDLAKVGEKTATSAAGAAVGGPQGFWASNWKTLLISWLLWNLLVIGLSVFSIYLICTCTAGNMEAGLLRGLGIGSLSGGNQTETGQGAGGTLQKQCIEQINSAASKYVDLANKYAAIYNVDPAVILAIMEQESTFNPNAYRYEPSIPDSSYGLMQTLYGTAKGMGYKGSPEGLYDPDTSVNYGTKYIAQQISSFKSVELALGAYNGGPGCVKNGQIICSDARNYSKTVMTQINKYRKCLALPVGNVGQCEQGRQINGVVMHWTAGAYDQDYSDYHVMVHKDGTLVKMNPYNVRTAHAEEANSDTIGISLTAMGGNGVGPNTYIDITNDTKSISPPTPAQIQAMAKAIADLSKCYGFPIDRQHVRGHGEVAIDSSTFYDRWELMGKNNGKCKYTIFHKWYNQTFCNYNEDIRQMALGYANAAQPVGGKVALTFDDGPSNLSSQIVNILKQNNVSATFFEVGDKIGESTVSAEVSAGNEVGNHTYDHPQSVNNAQGGLNFYQLSADKQKEEISKTNNLLKKVVSSVRWFRPPGGHAAKPEVLQQFGLQQVCWDIDSDDWQAASADTIKNNILSNLSDNAVILMHDGGSNSAKTVEALPSIIKGITEKGYQIVPLSQITLSDKVKNCYQK